MDTNNNIKRLYITPAIVYIKLDNEIALIMESDPMEGPDEGLLQPENFKIQPYHTDLA